MHQIGLSKLIQFIAAEHEASGAQLMIEDYWSISPAGLEDAYIKLLADSPF